MLSVLSTANFKTILKLTDVEFLIKETTFNNSAADFHVAVRMYILWKDDKMFL